MLVPVEICCSYCHNSETLERAVDPVQPPRGPFGMVDKGDLYRCQECGAYTLFTTELKTKWHPGTVKHHFQNLEMRWQADQLRREADRLDVVSSTKRA